MAKRYYNLEKETKEYLKACEAKSVAPFRAIKDINDIVITQKAFNKSINFIKDLNLNGCVLWLDAGIISSYSGIGTTWIDLTQNGNNGTLSSSSLYTRINGDSMLMTGNSFAEIPSSNSLNLSAPTFSISLWLRLNVLMTTTYYNLVSKKTDFNSNHTGWMFWYDNRNNSVLQVRLNSNAVSDTIIQSSGVINTAALNRLEWINVVFSMTNNDSTFFYINGSRVGISVLTGNFGTLANSVALRVGRGQGTISPNMFVNNVQIFNRALTAPEVLQNYNAMKGRFGL
jgi:hypothetical protein